MMEIFRFTNFILITLHTVASTGLNNGLNGSYNGLNSDDVLSVLEFCKNNGKRHLNVLTLDKQDLNVQITAKDLSFMAKSKDGIYTRNVKPIDDRIDLQLMNFYQDSLVILASATDTTYWNKYVEMMTHTKIMSSMIVMIGDMGQEKVEVMKSSLEKLATNSFFYWVYTSDGHGSELLWNQVLTLDHYDHIVTNRLAFNPANGIILEDYNLQGLHLVSMTLSWAPYLTVSNCREGKHPKGPNKNCETSGYLHETMNIFSKVLNFTWESHNEPENKWGTVPLSGPANVSGEWGGILGYVMRHEYQISISSWVWNEDRNDMFDFVTIIGDRVVLIAKPQRDPIDPGLFIRPFQAEAWYVVGLTVAVIIGCLIFPTMFAPTFSNTTSFKVVSSIGSLFFMLTEIYYSGALTMFFSTEVSLPFETAADVMQTYPSWKLMMQSENDVYFIGKGNDGDKDYVAWYERVTNLPDETVFNSVSEGVDLMSNGVVVSH